MDEEDTMSAHVARTIQFLAKTAIGWQIWKETEPELFWFFERTYRAWKCNVKFTGDEHTYLIELELPSEQVARVEKALKDGTLAVEVDKIHGIDPILHRGKKDAKFSKFQVSLAPSRPANIETRKTIEALERRLLEIELHERARSIDLRVVMRDLQTFQIDMYKRFEELDRRVEDGLVALSQKCERMEKAVTKYKPGA
ncbi:hypothetical protein BC831DRAFT_455220 [Entophlyctis helioformis]|nr:hypothetical protein BC831DRAFT_455220 [Entophlyctis helioformis]